MLLLECPHSMMSRSLITFIKSQICGIAPFEKAATVDERFIAVNFFLSDCYLRMGMVSEAIDSLKKALQEKNDETYK